MNSYLKRERLSQRGLGNHIGRLTTIPLLPLAGVLCLLNENTIFSVMRLWQIHRTIYTRYLKVRLQGARKIVSTKRYSLEKRASSDTFWTFLNSTQLRTAQEDVGGIFIVDVKSLVQHLEPWPLSHMPLQLSLQESVINRHYVGSHFKISKMQYR